MALRRSLAETEASGAAGTSAAGGLEQDMLDIHEQQLLMLLFMVRSELDEGAIDAQRDDSVRSAPPAAKSTEC